MYVCFVNRNNFSLRLFKEGPLNMKSPGLISLKDMYGWREARERYGGTGGADELGGSWITRDQYFIRCTFPAGL